MASCKSPFMHYFHTPRNIRPHQRTGVGIPCRRTFYGISCHDLAGCKYSGVRRLDQVVDLARSGWSAISPEGTHIVVWNLFDGLDFYSIADRVLSHSTPCPINQQNNKPVPVLFNGDGSIIIVGGTFGSIRVMDSSSYETLQVLSHDG